MASFLRRVQRTAYLTSRTAGDIRAAQAGRLVKRIVRRSITRRAFQIFRNGTR